MPHIVVDDEQAKILNASADRIEILDREGRHLGYAVQDFTPAEIALAKQRKESNEPRRTAQQVRERMNSLAQS